MFKKNNKHSLLPIAFLCVYSIGCSNTTPFLKQYGALGLNENETKNTHLDILSTQLKPPTEPDAKNTVPANTASTTTTTTKTAVNTTTATETTTASTAATPTPDAYEMAIIQAAIDECTRVIKIEQNMSNGETDIDDILKVAGSIITFPESTVTSVIGAIASPFVGTSTTTSSPSLPNSSTLLQAGQTFVANNYCLARNKAYYEGLYNTIGLLCQSNEQLFGSFKFENLSRRHKNVYTPAIGATSCPTNPSNIVGANKSAPQSQQPVKQ